jgi:hypothetical protein
MRVGKKLSAFLLGILLLFDALIAYRLFDHGWPKYLKAGPSETLQVVRVPFTWQDGLILLGIAALHALVIYAFRKSRIVSVQHNRPGSTSTTH